MVHCFCCHFASAFLHSSLPSLQPTPTSGACPLSFPPSLRLRIHPPVCPCTPCRTLSPTPARFWGCGLRTTQSINDGRLGLGRNQTPPGGPCWGGRSRGGEGGRWGGSRGYCLRLPPLYWRMLYVTFYIRWLGRWGGGSKVVVSVFCTLDVHKL